MNSEDNFQGIWDNSPFVAWIHNISKNQMKYLNSHIKDMNLGHEMRYIMAIFDNPGISQDDLVNIYGESKANVAKAVKKLEDEGFINREINPENRRKYMLKTTEKGDELVPKIRKISADWENEVGITDDDNEFKERLIKIAIKSSEIIK